MMQKQRGLTLISWVIILSLVGIQAVLAMRIIPVYMTFYSVKNIMDHVASDTSLRGVSPEQLRTSISKRLGIEGVYDLRDDKNAFTFQRTGESTIITLNYESRGPILGNLEFVATFDYEVEVPSK